MAGAGTTEQELAAKAARRQAAKGAGPGKAASARAAGEPAPAPGRDDIRTMIGAVARFAASFETALRQLDPGLTLSQLEALECVAEREDMRPFRLAAQMRISRQLAWQTCKRLEALGLAEMEDRETGRRGVTVTATEAGQAHLARIHELYDRLSASLAAEPRRMAVGPVRQALGRLAAAAAALNEAAPGDEPEAGSPKARRPGRGKGDEGGKARAGGKPKPAAAP